MGTHNNWSIPQQLSEKQKTSIKVQELSSLYLFKTRTERDGIYRNETV